MRSHSVTSPLIATEILSCLRNVNLGEENGGSKRSLKDKKYNRALFLLDEVCRARHFLLSLTSHQTLKTHSDIPIYTTKCDILIQLNRVEDAIDVAKEMALANEQSPEVREDVALT